MTDSILHVVDYFSYFSYPPTIEEVYRFLSIKVSKREFNSTISQLESSKKILVTEGRISRQDNLFLVYNKKKVISQQYITSVYTFIPFLQYIPSVLYVGISGSLSMLNTSKKGDIDLFVITTENTLWITRLVILVYKRIVTIVQKDIGSKLCLNMLFSEKGLQIPVHKQNEYIGHELLQLKTVFDKGQTYDHLLQKNKWVTGLFPNIRIKNIKYNLDTRLSLQSKITSVIDSLLKNMQVWWLSRKTYKWHEENNQLWLIQKDFEEKLRQDNLI